MILNDKLRSVLPSRGLPDDRCGSARGSQLTPGERDLYRWILRCFAAGGSPSTDDVAAAARVNGVEVAAAIRRMVEMDLIQLTGGGSIDSAYPFSSRPTTHTVVLDDGISLHAMCAVDALGIPIMLHRAGVIYTEDPASGGPIRIQLDASGAAVAQPADAVVVCAVGRGPGPLSSLCCPLVNTFESRATAERFLSSRPELSGSILSVSDAVACGAAVFGGVLD
jgi:alkylmercury lyase